MEIFSLDSLSASTPIDGVTSSNPTQAASPDFFLQLLTAFFPSLLTQMMPNIQLSEASEKSKPVEPEPKIESPDPAQPTLDGSILSYFMDLIQQQMPPQMSPAPPAETVAQTESQALPQPHPVTLPQPQVMQALPKDNSKKDSTDNKILEVMIEGPKLDVKEVPKVSNLTQSTQQGDDVKITAPVVAADIPRHAHAVQLLQDFAQVVQDHINQQPPTSFTPVATTQTATPPNYTPTPTPVTSVTIDIPTTNMDKSVNEAIHANIRIYPPELGQVLAKLKITKNVATLTITSENQAVKDIIQANLSQLKEQFHQAGLTIQSVTLDLQPNLAATDQNPEFSQQQKPPVPEEELQGPLAVSETKDKQTVNIDSLVDTYA